MLINDVITWGRERGIDDPKAQLNKVLEELGELAHEINRNNYKSDATVDAIGDTLVTIIILSDILGYDPMQCLESAYKEIAPRTGKLEKGSWIKDAKEN